MSVLARQPPEADLAEPEYLADRDTTGSAGPGIATLPLLLALLSLGAGSIHFAFASDHFTQGWAHGAFFLAVGWLQLAWAVALVLRPSRRLFLLGPLNAGVIVIWVLSRTAGLPLVPHGSTIEAVGVADTTASVFELVIMLGSMAALARPGLLRGRVASRPAVSIVTAGLVVAGVSAVGLTPSFASHHSHAAAAGVAHDHGASAGLTGATPCEKAGPPASPAQVTDTEGHFHRGPTPQVALDQPTLALLAQQQVQARAVAARYPTVAEAQRAGYRMSTPYVPCIGAHYTNVALVARFDPAAPSELLYDGATPDAHLVGLSYLVLHPGGPPEGFAGPNDRWHQHNANGGLCINPAGVVVGAEGTSPAQCQAAGGRKVLLTDIWMLHDWVVPGMECSWGSFAPECPELGGRVGGTAWDAPDPKSAAQLGTG
ncbi:MAG TPA: hypothetical protein VKI20_07210 [Acidimicrobiales bacterium]|nr:hypothetical protein [Acidimicrobiales bacterium]